MTSAAVRGTGLRVVRDGNEILRSIDFAVATATITGLLGPSGCGKTTLMRSILGTQAITAGSIEVLGRQAGTPSLRTEVGYGSQQASVYDDLTVVENLRYFAVAVRARSGDVDRVIEQVDLGRNATSLTGQAHPRCSAPRGC